MARFVGLSSADIEEVKHSSMDLAVQRIHFLEKWKKKFAFTATYRCLIEALLKCELTDLAVYVCSLLSSKQGTVGIKDCHTTMSFIILSHFRVRCCLLSINLHCKQSRLCLIVTCSYMYVHFYLCVYVYVCVCYTIDDGYTVQGFVGGAHF